MSFDRDDSSNGAGRARELAKVILEEYIHPSKLGSAQAVIAYDRVILACFKLGLSPSRKQMDIIHKSLNNYKTESFCESARRSYRTVHRTAKEEESEQHETERTKNLAIFLKNNQVEKDEALELLSKDVSFFRPGQTFKDW